MNKQKIWLITGVSGGLGRALANEVIRRGDFVIGSFRSQVQADDFNNLYRKEGLGLILDVGKPDEIRNAFEFITGKFERIDVLVNNAGIGFVGAIEETGMQEAREVFETNFFGPLALTQTFLPLFRRQRNGHIIQISSHGGVKAFAGFGLYNASKFALEGFSEALAIEAAALGIKLTIVEPGPFRTNFAGSSLRKAAVVIEDYGSTAGVFRENLSKANGRQEGDPVKAARAIAEIVKLESPPLRLPLGKISIMSINAKLESLHKDILDNREIAESCVFSS